MGNADPCSFRSAAGFVSACALVFAAVPARASIGLDGIDPVVRWVKTTPYVCAASAPGTAYWVKSAMANDYKIFKYSDASAEWELRREGGETMEAPVKIEGYYDAAHHIGGYVQSGTDTDNAMLFASAPPPLGGKMTKRGLSGVRLAGNIALGQTVAQVASDVGLHALTPVALGVPCSGDTAVGFCNWNAHGCRCPESGYAERVLGVVLFHAGRVVALSWDYGPCGAG